MYKLIIVDDEQEVRKGIINTIDWCELGFQVVGEAENGREALDLIEEDIPDVIITDISMQIMDGLELTASIRELYSMVKIVILTGYDDFMYAQKAVHFGVSDYILKPVLPQDILKLMHNLKSRIDDEIAEKEDKEKLQKHFTESMPVLRESFLTSLIMIKPNKKDTEKKINFFNLQIHGEYFATAVITCDNESLSEAKNITRDTDQLMFLIQNIAQEILKRHSVGEIFFFNNTSVIIMGIQNDQRSITCNKIISYMDEIRQSIERFLKLTVTIGLGKVQNSIDKMQESYKAALTALDYKLVIGGNKVIFIEDVEHRGTDIIVFDDEKERMLISSIKFGTEQDIVSAIDAIFDDINGAKVSIKEYRLFFLEIFATILKLARAFDFDTMEILSDDNFEDLDMNRFNTTDEVKDRLRSMCVRLMIQIKNQRMNTTQTLFEKAKDYISKNYGDCELCAKKLANHLYISTSYLGLVFKKEANTSFLKHLISVRLEVAVRMLEDPNIKLTEVAEKVGYSDVSYFSYFFKKNFGVSPREYRSKGSTR